MELLGKSPIKIKSEPTGPAIEGKAVSSEKTRTLRESITSKGNVAPKPSSSTSPRGRGRPRKTETAASSTPKQSGGPESGKITHSDKLGTTEVKRGRGRPPKITTEPKTVVIDDDKVKHALKAKDTKDTEKSMISSRSLTRSSNMKQRDVSDEHISISLPSIESTLQEQQQDPSNTETGSGKLSLNREQASLSLTKASVKKKYMIKKPSLEGKHVIVEEDGEALLGGSNDDAQGVAVESTSLEPGEIEGFNSEEKSGAEPGEVYYKIESGEIEYDKEVQNEDPEEEEEEGEVDMSTEDQVKTTDTEDVHQSNADQDEDETTGSEV